MIFHNSLNKNNLFTHVRPIVEGFFFNFKTHRHPNLYVYDMPCQLELPQLANNRLVERKLVANGFIFQTKISLLVTASEMYGFADFLSVIIVNEDSLGF